MTRPKSCQGAGARPRASNQAPVTWYLCCQINYISARTFKGPSSLPKTKAMAYDYDAELREAERRVQWIRESIIGAEQHGVST